MQAQNLVPGQEFKQKGQRRWRTVTKVIELPDHDHIPPLGRKVLVLHDGCKQLSILKETEVIVKVEADNIPSN